MISVGFSDPSNKAAKRALHLLRAKLIRMFYFIGIGRVNHFLTEGRSSKEQGLLLVQSIEQHTHTHTHTMSAMEEKKTFFNDDQLCCADWRIGLCKKKKSDRSSSGLFVDHANGVVRSV